MDILNAIRELKIRSLKRSITSSENLEKKVQNTATKTQAVLKGEFKGQEHIEEYVMRDLYNKLMEEYSRKKSWSYFNQPFTPKGLALWSRVVKAAKTANVEPENYLRSQFVYFHEVFKKTPTVTQLTTENAVLRAASTAPKKVTIVSMEADIDKLELFKTCEKQMNSLMRNQKMSREDVYRKLVIPGLIVFPAAYLDVDPTWKKVKE